MSTATAETTTEATDVPTEATEPPEATHAPRGRGDAWWRSRWSSCGPTL